MNRKDVLLWLALVVLTITTYYFSENQLTGMALVIGLMIIAAIKFLGIGFRYMELYRAHRLWQVLFVGFCVVFGVLVLALA